MRIVTGNTTVGPNDGGSANDVVVMDDFLYGEPLEIKPAAQGNGAAAAEPEPDQTGRRSGADG